MSSSMFRRRSRSRVRKHRAQWKAKIATPELTQCPNPACGVLKPAARACPECGRYRNRQVIEPQRGR